MAMDLINQHGGIGGVLDKFKEGGLANEVASWVSTGENLPISAEQISAVLGDGQIAQMAAKFGISPEVISSQIAENLPALVDKLTPNGELPDDNAGILGQLMGMLKA